MAVDKHTKALLRAMEIPQQDLLANQKGTLTPFQEQKVELMTDMIVSDILNGPPIFVPGAIKLVLIAIVVGLAYWLGGFTLLQGWLGPYYWPVVGAAALLVFGPLLWSQFKYFVVRYVSPGIFIKSLDEIALHSVSGDGHLVEEELFDEINYWLHVGDKKFALNIAGGRAFRDGKSCRVYYVYVGADEMLMSVEYLPKA